MQTNILLSADGKTLKLTYNIVLNEEMDVNIFIMEISNMSNIIEPSIIAALNDIDY